MALAFAIEDAHKAYKNGDQGQARKYIAAHMDEIK